MLNREKIKRMFDIWISGIALLLSAPLFGLVCIVIKLTSKGPIYYHWKVVGKDGKPFVSYKFRTMYNDADDHKKKLWDENEMNGPVFKMKNDPRITPIGKFLRKFSIDEVSQLFGLLELFVLDFEIVADFSPTLFLNKLTFKRRDYYYCKAVDKDGKSFTNYEFRAIAADIHDKGRKFHEHI